MTWLPPAWSTTGTSSPSTSDPAPGVHLFCLADVLAKRMEASPSPRLALYGHSMGRSSPSRWPSGSRTPAGWNTSSWRPLVRHVKCPTALLPPPWRLSFAAASAASSGAMSERAREVLLEDLALLATYPDRRPAGHLRVPATILYSMDDLVVPATDSVHWAAWCSPAPRLVEVSGGHLFRRTNPDVLEIVRTTLCPRTQFDPALPGTASVQPTT